MKVGTALNLKSRSNAAEILVQARLEGLVTDRLPEACRPASDDDALAIQLRVIELLGTTIGGWKVSLPRGENLFVAPLPAAAIYSTSPCPILPFHGRARIEPEIAFVLGRDLPPRSSAYTKDDLLDAIAETRLDLELIGCRYADHSVLPFREFLADSINNQGLFVGPSVPNAHDQNLEYFKIRIDGPSGTIVDQEGRHPNGHPLKPLVWLANFLSGRGETLKEGMMITTGSYAGILEVPLNTPLTVVYDGIGSFSVSFGRITRI